MVKHCRQCECIMPGQARFCPRCRAPWRQVYAHSLADAADLLQPPVFCGTCRKQLNVAVFFCPRCGADCIFGTPPAGWRHAVAVPPTVSIF